MWPLDLPPREVLKLSGETVIPWAVFDAGWYLRTYPDVKTQDPATVLDHYLTKGQRQGHSPNRMFDEQWHRLRYPRLSKRIDAGDYSSAFDAYCRRGLLDRSAHWLFDELAYRDRYPDLTNAVFAATEIYNGYDHYLRHGILEDRIGHVLFDPAYYLSHFDPVDVAAIREYGVFQHYLNRIESGEPELPTSIYFDPAWYVRQYPDVAAAIAANRWKCALQHYLCNDTPTAFDPLPDFSEAWYLQRDPGLLDAIASQSFRNGYMHFLQFGTRELRSPAASIDLAWYAAQPPVRADLENQRASDAFAHWRTIGAAAGLPPAAPTEEKLSPLQARHLSRQMATALLPIAGRFGIDFECRGPAVVSVVLPVRDGFAATMATIASLRANAALDIELVIVDRGSQDETCSIGRYVRGAKIVRFETDIGWSRAVEAGRHLCAAGSILFLSSEAQIAPGSLHRALDRLTNDSSVGAVGALILQPHGVVAQAGGILWNDGRAHDYKRDASPLEPEVNFVRDVDFCAASFLLIRASLLTELKGFDDDCAPDDRAIDLCVRIAQAGYRVVYDPSVLIVLAEPPVPDAGRGARFLDKHAELLARRFPAGGPIQVFARHAGRQPHRVLFIEDTVPLRRHGSGFVRANDLVKAMADLGCAVTVFPMTACDHNPAQVFGDMPETAEVMHTLSFDRLSAFLDARPGYFDTIWIARVHNLHRVKPLLLRLVADGTVRGRIVLDTEAVVPYREAMQAALAGDGYDLSVAMRAFAAAADLCHQTLAVTVTEAGALHQHGFPNVAVVGHMITPCPTARPFAQRSGMLFVGAIHKADSPNLDSLIWFVDAVLPLIEAALKWETRLTIAGYIAPGVDLSRFRNHARISLRGPVDDLQPLYNSHRVFVAPTRYAAGAPYKVLEAASRGVPVVATDLLRTELGWVAGQDILSGAADDPAAFAAHIIALYKDEALWTRVRQGALERLERDHAPRAFYHAVAAVIHPHAV